MTKPASALQLSCLARIQNAVVPVFLALVAGVALSATFLDVGAFYLAWVAFVPLLFALRHLGVFKAYSLGVLFGFIAFALGKFWLVDFIQLSKGFSAHKTWGLAALYYFYSGQQFGIAAALMVWLKRRMQWSVVWLFPLVFAAVSMAYPLLFPFRLGETQTAFTLSLQATDLAGTNGLSVVILCVNALTFYLLAWLFRSCQSTHPILIGVLVTLPFAWGVYGAVSLAQWQKAEASATAFNVGLIQPNEKPKLGKRIVMPGYSLAYPPELSMSESLAERSLQLIVWPEGQPKRYFDNARVKAAYSRAVASIQTPLLFQDFRSVAAGDAVHFNSAILLGANGDELGVYDKVKRIPFGEYAPFSESSELIAKLMRDFLGEYLFEIAPGQQHKALSLSEAQLLPFICYETTFPTFMADAATRAIKNSQGNPLVLVGLSNDGWFNSRQQAHQHIVASALRAVENRLPLIHISNNGPSIAVAPSGKIVARTPSQVFGAYEVSVSLIKKSKPTFFASFPLLINYFLYACLIVVVLIAMFSRRPA